MHESMEALLLIAGAGAAVAVCAKRFAVPYNVALVLMGLSLVLLGVLPRIRLDPELVLLVFLPVLVFEGALFADAGSLLAARRPILALALLGVAMSLLATAGIATIVLKLPFSVALLLGALLAITDTVSVLLAFRAVRVPHRLSAIMEGESLFNDGTALVLVSLAAGVLATGHFDAAATARTLLLAIVGGVAVGAVVGGIGAAVLQRMPDHLTAIVVSAVLVFGASVVAERLHASAVIAVVVTGLVVGRAARQKLEPSHVLALHGFWETTGFALNVVLFLLIGMQLDASLLLAELGTIALAVLALHAGRAVTVYGVFGLLRILRLEAVPARWQHVMVLGNVKGALSMAAVLALPQDLPFRDRLITIVFGVTFVTLVTQALPFASLLRRLRVTLGPPDAGRESARATLITARRGQSDLDELLGTGLLSRRDHAERRAGFQRMIVAAEAALRAPAGTIAGERDVVSLALADGGKAALVDAARRGLITYQMASAHVATLDRARDAGNHHSPLARPLAATERS